MKAVTPVVIRNYYLHLSLLRISRFHIVLQNQGKSYINRKIDREIFPFFPVANANISQKIWKSSTLPKTNKIKQKWKGQIPESNKDLFCISETEMTNTHFYFHWIFKVGAQFHGIPVLTQIVSTSISTRTHYSERSIEEAGTEPIYQTKRSCLIFSQLVIITGISCSVLSWQMCKSDSKK